MNDTVAVDRAALIEELDGRFSLDPTQVGAEDIVDYLLSSRILRDAAAIRHEHGEHIAKAIEATAEGVSGLARIGVYHVARIARDLSPPPGERNGGAS